MGPQEPTFEDYCGMSDHDLSERNPETGWRECMCGMFTEPLGGEPHDEYSAYCTDLIDAYLSELTKAITGNPTYVGIQAAKMRTIVAPMLRHETPEYLAALLASIRSSNSDHLVEYVHPYEGAFDMAVVLGVHLSSTGRRAVDDVLLDNLDESFRLDKHGHRRKGMDLINDQSITLARAAARLYSLLNGVYRRSPGYQPEDALRAVCPLLAQHLDLIPTVASLYNEDGITESTTARAIGFINSPKSAHSQPLIAGLL